MTDHLGRAVTSVTVSHVIVRACAACGHPRQAGTPCAGCGNPDPPVVHELGQQAARYRNPFRQAWWRYAGAPAAARRARRIAGHARPSPGGE